LEPQPPGTLRACPDLNRDYSTITSFYYYLYLSLFFATMKHTVTMLDARTAGHATELDDKDEKVGACRMHGNENNCTCDFDG